MRRTTTPGAARVGRDPEGERPTREPLPTRVEDLPSLPAAYAETLDAGLAGLGLDLPAPVRAAVDDHVRLLLAWTAAINLTAIRDPEAVAREHVLDSLAALPLLRARGVDRLLDLGSGGGYPGFPLAAALPARRALLVDSVAKKARFLETAIAAIGLTGRVDVATRRAEELARDRRERARWPLVTARAVAPLAELVELGLPLLAQGGLLLAWKREPLDAELAAAEPSVAALGGVLGEVMAVPVEGLADHRLIAVVKRRPTPDRFPRDPAARRRQPWPIT
ncbi:MAG TPA: 16S rRNA (guanine(527)-N(7))-methyltransferase RsmG [Candidatus Limnocylindrales bacterium]